MSKVAQKSVQSEWEVTTARSVGHGYVIDNPRHLGISTRMICETQFVRLLEPALQRAANIQHALGMYGMQVHHAKTMAGLQAMKQMRPYAAIIVDTVVLDQAEGKGEAGMLPGKERVPTLYLIRQSRKGDIRKYGYRRPEPFDFVVGPFCTMEVAVRLCELLREREETSHSVLRLGDLTMDDSAKRVSVRGEQADPTAKEYALLQNFMLNSSRVISKSELLAAIDPKGDVSKNVIEVYVSRIRAAIGQANVQILTIRGQGYMLECTEHSNACKMSNPR